jgi:hypothetical protein
MFPFSRTFNCQSKSLKQKKLLANGFYKHEQGGLG